MKKVRPLRPSGHVERGGFHLPLTVSSPGLILNGSDRAIRSLIYDVGYLAEIIEAARSGLARQMNITTPQYNMLMVIGELMGTKGVSVGDVAKYLHVSSSFVTTETNHLVAGNLVEKSYNENDRRGTLLKLTAKAQREIEYLMENIRFTNDNVFKSLTRSGLQTLGKTISRLIADGEVLLTQTGVPEPASRRMAVFVRRKWHLNQL